MSTVILSPLSMHMLNFILFYLVFYLSGCYHSPGAPGFPTRASNNRSLQPTQ